MKSDLIEKMDAELEVIIENELINPTTGKSGKEYLGMLLDKLREKYPEGFEQICDEAKMGTSPVRPVKYQCLMSFLQYYT